MFLFFTCFQLTDAAILPVKLSCEIYAHSDQQGDLCGMSVNGDASRATAQEVLNQIAKSYLQIVESSTKKEFNEFMEYLTRMGKVLVVDVIKGSLMIKVGCRSVQILSDLYIDFLTARTPCDREGSYQVCPHGSKTHYKHFRERVQKLSKAIKGICR